METENNEEIIDDLNEDQATQKFKVTMELPLFLSMLGIIIAGAPTSNLILFRTCVHSLNHSTDECHSFLLPETINHTQELENEVQHYATFVTTVRTVLQSVVPAVMSVLIGVWSDRHGRRPLIVLPLLGMFVSSVMTVVYSLIQSLGPWWYVATVVPYSLSGGFAVLYIGCMCYVTDITTADNRTVRILYVKLACTIASAMGSSVSPYLLKGLGNMSYLLLIETALYAVAYAYSAVLLKESLRTATPVWSDLKNNTKKKAAKINKAAGGTGGGPALLSKLTDLEQRVLNIIGNQAATGLVDVVESGFSQGTFATVLNIAHVKEMFHVCFKKKPNYGRAIILLVAASSGLFVFVVYGIAGILYLYTRNKIHWTMKDFTTFKSVSTAMWFVGSIFAVSVLQPAFRISDVSFTLIAYMGCIIEYLIEGLATSTWHMYLGSAVSLFGATTGTFLRSFLSKILPATDTAKVFALLGSEEAVSPLVAPVLYNMLYAYTIDSFPGAFLILSVALTIMCFVILTIVPCLLRKSSSSPYEIIDEETDRD